MAAGLFLIVPVLFRYWFWYRSATLQDENYQL